MKQHLALRGIWMLALFGGLVLGAACGRNAPPRPTPTGPALTNPTALPPAPTAPPLTAAPTEIVPTAVAPTAVVQTVVAATAVAPTEVTIPTVTPPTSSSGGQNNSAPPSGVSGGGTSGKRGVFITRLRLDPATPRNKELVTFYATFSNTTGSPVQAAWCAEVFRPGAKQAMGGTSCKPQIIPCGVSEQSVRGWQIVGVRSCMPLLARIVFIADNGVRVPYALPNGSAYWLNFNACP